MDAAALAEWLGHRVVGDRAEGEWPDLLRSMVEAVFDAPFGEVVSQDALEALVLEHLRGERLAELADLVAGSLLPAQIQQLRTDQAPIGRWLSESGRRALLELVVERDLIDPAWIGLVFRQPAIEELFAETLLASLRDFSASIPRLLQGVVPSPLARLAKLGGFSGFGGRSKPDSASPRRGSESESHSASTPASAPASERPRAADERGTAGRAPAADARGAGADRPTGPTGPTGAGGQGVGSADARGDGAAGTSWYGRRSSSSGRTEGGGGLGARFIDEVESRLEPEIRRFLQGGTRRALERAARFATDHVDDDVSRESRSEVVRFALEQTGAFHVASATDARLEQVGSIARGLAEGISARNEAQSMAREMIGRFFARHRAKTFREVLAAHGIVSEPAYALWAALTWPVVRVALQGEGVATWIRRIAGEITDPEVESESRLEAVHREGVGE